MESEKVKEIKKALECWQESVMLSTDENYVSHKVYNREILDYINDLESENERLMKLQARGGCRVAELGIENQQLKDRISELEKELEKEQINNLNCDIELQYKEKRIAELEKENANKTDTITDLLKKQEFYEKEKLTKFAERLKEKLKEKVNADNVDVFVECAKLISETLKEFINT